MSEAEQSLEEVLIGLLTQAKVGSLDARDGKRRWIFYLAHGNIVYSKSNLKSERIESIREKLGDIGNEALLLSQLTRRIRNACSASEWRFTEGDVSARTLSIQTQPALFRGIASRRTIEEMQERMQPLSAGNPQLKDGISSVNVGAGKEIHNTLNALDGSRKGSDVIEFGPGDPRKFLTALWMAWQQGDIVLVGPQEDAVAPAPVAPPRETAPPQEEPAPVERPTAEKKPATPAPPTDITSDLGFDLDALIAQVSSSDAQPSENTTVTDPREAYLESVAERLRAAENHFEVLGLPWNSPVPEFRAAYRTLAQKLHPDRFIHNSADLQQLATELFDKIREAWEVLEDDVAREKYIDKVIHGKKSEEDLAMEQVQQYMQAEADFKRGQAAFNQGRISQAHEAFEAATTAVPDELEFKAYFGYTTFALNRTTNSEAAQEGIDILKEVIDRNQEQERKLDNAWALLGRAYRENDEKDKAKRCLVQALRINASNTDAVRELQRLENPDKHKKSGKKGVFSRLFQRKK